MIKKIAVKHFVFTLAVCAGLMWAVSPPALAEEIGAVPADSLLAAAEKTAAEQTVALEEATMGAAIDPVAEFKAKILTLVNEAREKEGLNALSLTDQLSAIADVRAEEAATRFSHTRPDGTKCFSVFSQYDVSYRFAG